MKRTIYFGYLNLMKGSRAIAKKAYRRLDKSISNMFKSTYVEINGHMFFLDKGDTTDFGVKEYEPGSIKLMKQLIKKDDIVIDLGANVGIYTLEYARLVGEKGKVFAFEPEPKIFNLLQKNIQINNYQNVTPIKKAVIDKVGEEKLYVSDNLGDSVMYNEFQGKNPLNVETTTLNYFFKDFNRKIDFIKIDCDGSETRILKSGKKLFEKNKDIMLLVEFVPDRIRDSGLTPKEFLDLISSFGFEIFAVDEYEPKYKKSDLNELLKECEKRRNNPQGQGEYVNLLCLKNKNEKSFG